MYAISFDAATAILMLQLTELWTPEVMRSFRDEILRQTDLARRSHPRVCILSDCRTYPVQSVPVMAGWGELLGEKSTYAWPPYAIVVGSVLNKLQAERALIARNIAIFSALDEAERWLQAKQKAMEQPTASG